MKKTTSVKSKFSKKRANAKQPVKSADRDTKKPTPEPEPPPTPPSDVVSVPAPEVKPSGPALTQAGHHEVVQS